MKNFPFISLPGSITVLRFTVALMFIAHALVRITGGTVDRFGEFLESKGLSQVSSSFGCSQRSKLPVEY